MNAHSTGRVGKPLPTKPPFEAAQTLSNELEVKRVVGAAYASCLAETMTLPLRAPEILSSDVSAVGEHVVFAARPDPQREKLSYHLIDVSSGKELSRFDGLWTGDASSSSAIVQRLPRKEEALLDMRDGSIRWPNIKTPEGAPESWTIVFDGSATIWLVARTKQKRIYYGAWPEPRERPVMLQQSLPFWPELVDGANGGMVSSSDLSCRLRPESPQCFPFERHAVLLGGRYLASFLNDTIRDLESGKVSDLEQECAWQIVASLPEPPRALLTCKTHTTQQWAIWSPSAIEPLALSDVELDAPSFSGNGRVVALELLDRPDALVTRWIDLQTSRVLSTPPLVPLEVQTRFGVRILVQVEDAPNELWLLDIEQRTLTLIARDLDCDAYLILNDETDERAIVACPKPSMQGNLFRPGLRLQHYQWLELIDFASRRRLRSEQVFEAQLTKSGIAVGIQPGKVAALAALHWPRACPSSVDER